MAQVTIDLPEENLPLLLEITETMGIRDKDVIIKDASPNWHNPILNERLESYKTEKFSATPWEDFVDELDREDDEGNELPKELQEKLQRGLDDYKNGQYISHDEMKQKVQQ